MTSHENQLAIVTGANSGIGLEVTKLLAGSGFIVVMACRSLDRANQAVADMQNETTSLKSSGSFVPMRLDLSDYDSVRKFASEFLAKFSRLDVLINNAGYAEEFSIKHPRLNSNGHEMTIATNHLGHFLLTKLLLQTLKDTASRHGAARVLIVSSDMHKVQFGFHGLDFDDPFMANPGSFSGGQAYKISKTMNILHCRKLARMLEGTGVSVNALHPGFIPTTNIMLDYSKCTQCLCVCCFSVLCCCCRFTRKPQEAAGHMFNIATGVPPYEDKSGLYFYDGRSCEVSEEASLPANEDRLWEWSEAVTE